MRNRTRIAWLVLLAGIALGCSRSQGQYPPARYQPSRPTVSPYLNLLRTDRGPLPNYYTFVRPQLEQQWTNQQLQAGIVQNRTNLQALGQQVGQIQAATMQPTGTGASFMNYSHYYGGNRR
jgi:hypothetical protein